MSDHNRKHNNQVEINDLIDDAVNNALVRRSEALLPLSDEEAQSISGGTGGTTSLLPAVLGVIINPNPIIHGVVINPNPTPCPPKPIINGIVIKPPIITIGVVIANADS